MIIKKKRVCVVTSTRADYGIMKPLIARLLGDGAFELSIVATGMHLCPEFGLTYREIEEEGFEIRRKIDIQASGDSPAAMSKTMGLALICFADYFAECRPELLIVLGDRHEMAAVCCAAANARVPIAHLCGGEACEGQVDEAYRHAITKMSYLHFTSCEAYRKRVIQLGEDPSRVFNFGDLCVENIKNEPAYPHAELERELGLALPPKGYAVVTYHPVTLEGDKEGQTEQLMAAMDALPGLSYIITKANSDAGGREINALWEEYAMARPHCAFTASLGMRRYLSAISQSAFILGNSSSGITEGPASGIPTVNIGERQRGRVQAESILNCAPEKGEIIAAMRRALTPEFQQIAANAANPFGDGSASIKILETIKSVLFEDKIELMKKFYDIRGEENA